MYYSVIRKEDMEGWRPFPNYLFAIAEWHFKRSHEPLDITSRKLRKYYQDKGPNAFLDNLRDTLYAGFALPTGTGFQPVSGRRLRSANVTLDAVAKMCEQADLRRTGIRAVITENYESLLEVALGNYPFQPIWKSVPLELKYTRLYRHASETYYGSSSWKSQYQGTRLFRLAFL